jgi:hypothetical protein
MAGAGNLNTNTFGIGVYQPIVGGVTVGDGFISAHGPSLRVANPYSGTFGGTYGFVLNTIMRQPKVHQYTPAPSIGLDGTGLPVIRGFPTIVWAYSSLRPDFWYYLKNLYQLAGSTPAGFQYLVLLQYPDESNPNGNTPIQQLAYWDPPAHAFRDVGAFYGVTLTYRYVGQLQLSPNAIVVPATA